jgi:hypothetical protein
MAAMAAVPWPLAAEPPEEGRYATLLQISIGQEEVDEVIARDIHRWGPCLRPTPWRLPRAARAAAR